MISDPPVKAVITGIGVAAPNGFGAREYWSATCAGRSGIGRISRFDATPYPAQLAGEIAEFDAGKHLPGRLLPQTDRMTQLALVTAEWALADAGARTDELAEYEMGVITASSSGGFEFGQRELKALWSQGGRYVSAYQSFAWFYAVNSGQISIRHGLRGPSGVLVSDQAGGLDAVAQARRHIRKGISLVLTGALDASLCPWGWVAQLTNDRISTSDDPERAYLPFDPAAHGHVPGEGGALLVLESEESARSRGAAHIYGEIAGYAATFDPHPGTGREPGLRRAIELALRDAGEEPAAIDMVLADGAAVQDLDRVEAEAISEVFGPHGVPVTVPKSMTGRLCSGAAPVDLAAAFLAMRDGVIPPTAHSTASADYAIDLVTSLRRARVRRALVVARGFGGFNSAMVVRSSDA
ncbi:ketosynthase chain-length factor [Streptomyces sp. ST2-7A]|uniref:ketosynthase chain-length factor n=1 Tax=Streptomyces sp. ST2-7A TaxID=2907214 RepID=UPI001F46B1AE|nr:ketosynthase chain-length factor [Streptomyces sp. ST2-7A]MCE7083343.1 ketosynthase chain-length factor [Streptomyces sp. ST2-7A]